jgi:uncharacterized membrane protein
LSISIAAILWIYFFNTAFEFWEYRQRTQRRSFLRRLIHGIGFEASLLLLTIPLLSLWLHISLHDAFLLDCSMVIGFVLYTIAFTWSFDRLMGLPASVRGRTVTDATSMT